MKDLKKFILESAKDLYQNLMDNFFCGVYELDEPEDPDAIKNLENIIITPHIASSAKEGRAVMEMEAVENLLRGLGLSDD